jgi:hypothetical protein
LSIFFPWGPAKFLQPHCFFSTIPNL